MSKDNCVAGNETRTGCHILSGPEGLQGIYFGSPCCFLYCVKLETTTWECASNTQGLRLLLELHLFESGFWHIYFVLLL